MAVMVVVVVLLLLLLLLLLLAVCGNEHAWHAAQGGPRESVVSRLQPPREVRK